MEVGGQGEALGMGRGTEKGLWAPKSEECILAFLPLPSPRGGHASLWGARDIFPRDPGAGFSADSLIAQL